MNDTDSTNSPVTELLDFGDCRIYVDPREHIVQYLRQTTPNEEGDSILNRMFEKSFELNSQINYLEVGCNFGLELIRAANKINKLTNNHHIAAFDPGEASSLVPKTIAENSLENIIYFAPIAISKDCEDVTFFCQPGHSEDNRMVNDWETATIQRSVSATTIDAYVEKNALNEGVIVAKIDTQGAEPEVLMGADKTLSRMAAIIEFTPWAIATRHNPLEFISKINDTHIIIDLDASRKQCKLVENNWEAFAEEVTARPPKWTDLLILPRSYPEFSQPIQKFVLG